MSFNIRDYVSNDHIESIGEIATGQARIIQALSLDNSQKDKEIERLNKGYCPIKVKCNKGECDCTNEEYNQMCEENIKLDLEIERLNNIFKEARETLINSKEYKMAKELDLTSKMSILIKLLEILNKAGG